MVIIFLMAVDKQGIEMLIFVTFMFSKAVNLCAQEKCNGLQTKVDV